VVRLDLSGPSEGWEGMVMLGKFRLGLLGCSDIFLFLLN
jgi:hypothetical protein